MPSNKIFRGHVVRAIENSFEGNDGAILKGKNIEIVGGKSGIRAWAPEGRDGYSILVEDAFVEVEVSVRVRDDGSLKYTVVAAKSAVEQTEKETETALF